MSVLELFCHVDDFCRQFEPLWHKQCLASGSRHRNRARELALSEIMTILILFHQSHYRTFKAFYTEHVCVDLRTEFPGLVSLFGKLIGDKGYLSNPLLKQLHTEFGIKLITAHRKNMKARELALLDKLLRKRAIVETIID